MSFTLKGFMVEVVAKVFRGPAFLVHSIRVATMTVFTSFLEAVGSGLVLDARKLKENAMLIAESSASEARAKADERIAEAQLRANEAAAESRRFALIDAEVLERTANAAETRAKADAIRMEAETNRQRAIVEAQANLVARLTELKRAGGLFIVDIERFNASLRQVANSEQESAASMQDQFDGKLNEVLSLPDIAIENLGFTNRTYSSLRKAGLVNLRSLTIVSEQELLRIRGFGASALSEVRDSLAKYGLKLRVHKWSDS